MRRAVRAAFVAALLVVLTAACAGVEEGGTDGYISGDGTITTLDPADREKAPELSGVDLEGEEISTADFAGQTIVVNLWGSWCPPCRKEMPMLKEVSDQYADKNVQFLGLLTQDTPAAAKAFNEKIGISYPSIVDDAGENQLAFADSLPSQAIPTTWILDEKGRVAARILDPELDASTLADLIEYVRKSTQ
ncbi:TlpA family protein disulfide reductase [Aeromicrobium camelliae]|uniref:TlpA family protein disulfide reductase n=1 Tax=Aeromicrobium camelliae TaxID=1538144 RepID=A0A3N6WK44_9ACTN|nr:TlpA disulfide reductase family protein [Aeromicrobium camelliae]RQN01683.1 TlpA family protein disulfide reductase [Aeromicrobium camelliae]